jgi:hypothetical protein
MKKKEHHQKEPKEANHRTFNEKKRGSIPENTVLMSAWPFATCMTWYNKMSAVLNKTLTAQFKYVQK